MKSFVSLPAAVLGILLVSGLSNPSAAFLHDDTVSTSSGLIRGHRSPNRPDVSEYLGIPYAQSPVGDLRFAPPVKYTSDQPFDASAFVSNLPASALSSLFPNNYIRCSELTYRFPQSLDCPQTPSKPVDYPDATEIQKTVIANFAGQNGNAQSEDCLKLNVWSKATLAPRKPVLIWLHGGRFTAGSTNNKFYQGQYLAEREDVIVVSLGYRLNIFGFSGAPGETQNVGLLDQRMAIEWVRDNIAGFGGDPDRITIFGQSAGGVAADYHSYAFSDDPIARAIIPMAGTALSMKPNTMEQSNKYWYTAASALGCGNFGDVLPCMRSKSTAELLAAVSKVPFEPSRALAQPVFHPTVDDKIVFSDYEALSAEGKFAKLPALIGNADYEAGYYRVSAFAAGVNLTDAEWDQFNLAGFTCAGARAASHRAEYDVPVWRYRYYGEWPNTILYPGSGAYHGTDVGQVFGTAEDASGGVENTEDEQKVSRYMMHAWALFARDPRHGLHWLGWPRYSEKADAKKFAAIAYKNDPNVNILPAAESDAGCAALGTDTSYAQGAF
ncbi:hypothetical protein AJ79_09539 [Helicocarpus griseus UAMH5409]|uniref:Carboxylic ester hydrolase n=1 Tax=Helicocarpus griseus UAMH5409 TaxID=1447875 RepID=A0A2B7WJ45_9EURO|nr:hypothetical protein AJ79_09539 [Helicocarpus griseus UAMH5409]